METVKYVIKRLLLAVLILLGVSVIIYGLARMMPTDFVDQQYQGALQQGTMTQEDIDRIKELYGLNMPDAYLTFTMGEGSQFAGESFEKNTKEAHLADVGLGALSYSGWYAGTYDGSHGRGLRLADADRVNFKLNGRTITCTLDKTSGKLRTSFDSVPFDRDGSSTESTVYGSWKGVDSTQPDSPKITLTINNNGGTYSLDGTDNKPIALEEFSLGGSLQIGQVEVYEEEVEEHDYIINDEGELEYLYNDDNTPKMVKHVITRERFNVQEDGTYFVNVNSDSKIPSLSFTINAEGSAGQVKSSVNVKYRVANFWDKAEAIFKSYFNWLGKLLQGDLGTSFKYKRPVADVIMQNMGISFAIAFIATVLQFAIAIPLGIKAAVNQYGVVDYTVTVFTMMGISLPTFFLAAIVIRVFSVGLGWFEVGGIASADLPVDASWFTRMGDMLWHMVLPMFVLVVLSIGSLMRYTRTNTLEALSADYVRTARAKGLSERTVIYKHAFRNTMVPLVTLLAGVLPSLFGGAMITEQVFSIPGIGKLAYDALVAADVPFIMGYNMFLAVLTVLGMLLSDLLYGIVDPRVKIGK